MRYGMLGGMQATKAPDRSGVLGYWYNNGGLNNQKMALLGLILCGIREKQAINLPYIYNKDQTTDREDVIPIAEVFNLDRIFAFARQHDLTILTQCPSGERGGWNYFDAFHDYIGNVPDRPSLQTIVDAVASLKSLIISKPAFLQLRDFACGALAACRS